jgi:cytochrome P450
VLELALQGGGIGAEMPLIRAVGRHIPFGIFKSMFAASDYLLGVAKKALKGVHASGDANLFAHIIREAEKGERLDDLDVQLEASGLIVAGSDTTATTLTYLIWAVLSRPALLGTIISEIKSLPSQCGDNELEDLPVLNAAVEETLRLYGAAPGALPRVVPEGGVTFADGKYFLPGGATVSTQSYTMHRDPTTFSRPFE